MVMGELRYYDAACKALQEARGIDEVKEIRDKATAMAEYAKQAKDKQLETWAAEIKLRAMRRLGEMSAQLEKAPGARTDKEPLPDAGKKLKAAALKEVDISTSVAHRCEQIAKIPEGEFVAYIAELKDKAKIPYPHVVQKEIKKEQREQEIEEQREAIAAGDISLPEGVYDVIVVDPPWPYGGKYDPVNRRATSPYPEMALEEIQALPIVEHAAKNCILWLWTTHKFMRYAFPLLDAWGFEDKSILTWCKDRFGVGDWLRSQSEFCIMAVRGKPKVHLTNQSTVLHGPLRQHSRKPDEFFEMVDGLCIAERKIDWFAREPRDGWETGGNDTGKFDAREKQSKGDPRRRNRKGVSQG